MTRKLSSATALLLAFVLVLLAGTLGCAREPGPLWADPGVIRLDTERVEVDVEIHNVSGTVRPVGEFALTGDDWGSLRFVDDSLPRTIPANDSVVVRLAVSPATFRTEPGIYRSGRASLVFASDQHELEVPIEFVGTAARQPSAPPRWLAILALALLGLIVTLVPIPRAGEPDLLTRLASPSATTTNERLGVAGALAALLLLAASLPLGPGLCSGRAGARVGPAELDQCRDGLGGFELTLLPADPGVWWWLIALALAAALMAVVRFRTRAPEPTIALPLVRSFGFALVLAAFATGLAPEGAATVDFALTQLRPTELGGLALPAWGLIAQPIACAATVALAVSLPSKPDTEPMLAALTRFERIVWAAMITTLFLGAWAVPGLSDRPVPPLTHAGTLAAELAMFASKTALVELALRKLGTTCEQREITPAQLLRAQARWTIPILLANLVAITLWRVI